MRADHSDFLIVDDEPGVCWALVHILKGAGANPIVASTGEQALELAAEHRVRLIFVDAKLPDVDGIELARRLRTTNPGVSIVMISGYFYRDDAEVHDAVAAGIINAFIGKPLLHEEIRRIAAQALV